MILASEVSPCPAQKCCLWSSFVEQTDVELSARASDMGQCSLLCAVIKQWAMINIHMPPISRLRKFSLSNVPVFLWEVLYDITSRIIDREYSNSSRPFLRLCKSGKFLRHRAFHIGVSCEARGCYELAKLAWPLLSFAASPLTLSPPPFPCYLETVALDTGVTYWKLRDEGTQAVLTNSCGPPTHVSGGFLGGLFLLLFKGVLVSSIVDAPV